MMSNSPAIAALLGGAGAIWRARASRLPAHRRGPRGVHFWRKGDVGPIVRERPFMTQSGHGSYRRQFTHRYCDLPGLSKYAGWFSYCFLKVNPFAMFAMMHAPV